jgi:hypothetical protein
LPGITIRDPHNTYPETSGTTSPSKPIKKEMYYDDRLLPTDHEKVADQWTV